ncbi:MAG: MFS transporter [Sphaerochaetaceae bacterium]|nr:MFS transporter [Sphaerochaetaceae bacterium]
MTARRKIGLVISLAGFAISVNTLPSLVTWFSAKFAIGSEWFGAIFLLQAAAFTFFSMAIGRLHKTKKMPLNGIVTASLLISAIFLVFIGYNTSFIILTLMMIIIGGCGGLVESIGTTLLADSDKNGRMLYLSQFFYGVGAFSAPLFVGALLKGGLQVPQIGVTIGSFAVGVGLLVFFLIIPSSKSEKVIQESVVLPVQEVPVATGSKLPASFIWLSLTMMSYVVLESSIANWLPVFLEKSYKLSTADASLTLTCYWIGLCISRLFFMFFKKKSTRGPLALHVAFMLASLLLLVTLGPALPTVVTMLIMGLVGYACGPVWPLLIENCSANHTDAHLIMYLVGAGSVGALTGPVLTSFLFTLTDINYMGYILIAYCVVLTMLLLKALSMEKTEEVLESY